MQVDDVGVQNFLKWFENAGGSLSGSVGVTQFPGMGQGAIAVQNIAKDSTLFTIPRSILLSARTSALRKALGETDWKALGSGWQPLIVSMMWEESKLDDSLWSGYLHDLPVTFDTLMFWEEQELEALQASTIRDKIGKSDAERDYYERVLPLLQRRADVFKPSHLSTHFTLERYHINGSRILSRSFQVEEWSDENDSQDHDVSSDAGLEEPDNDVETNLEEPSQETTIEDDEEEEETADDVAMVPMADILNARYGCNNAKLFYEREQLRMVAIQDIKAGDQIWNTYGDLPNSHLLRRYGYVDIIPCSRVEYLFPFENPADEVEIRADLVVDICVPAAQGDERVSKIDTWISLGGDDTFAVDNEDPLCKPMLGMIRYLSMTKIEVDQAISKDKLPKGKATGDVLKKALEVFLARLSQYATTIKEDEMALNDFMGTPDRVYNATFARLGEKRRLKQAIEKGEAILQAEKGINSSTKRAREPVGVGGFKKKTKR